jgi:hypothetical protein
VYAIYTNISVLSANYRPVAPKLPKLWPINESVNAAVAHPEGFFLLAKTARMKMYSEMREDTYLVITPEICLNWLN